MPFMRLLSHKSPYFQKIEEDFKLLIHFPHQGLLQHPANAKFSDGCRECTANLFTSLSSSMTLSLLFISQLGRNEIVDLRQFLVSLIFYASVLSPAVSRFNPLNMEEFLFFVSHSVPRVVLFNSVNMSDSYLKRKKIIISLQISRNYFSSVIPNPLTNMHMWLMGCHNPYKLQQNWEYTFLKVFDHTNTK